MASPYAVESVPRATNTTTHRLKALTICLLPTPGILASLSSVNGDVKFDEATRPATHLLYLYMPQDTKIITHVSHHGAVLQPLLLVPLSCHLFSPGLLVEPLLPQTMLKSVDTVGLVHMVWST